MSCTEQRVKASHTAYAPTLCKMAICYYADS